MAKNLRLFALMMVFFIIDTDEIFSQNEEVQFKFPISIKISTIPDSYLVHNVDSAWLGVSIETGRRIESMSK